MDECCENNVLQLALGCEVDLTCLDCASLNQVKIRLSQNLLKHALAASPTVAVKDEVWDLGRYSRAVREIIAWIDSQCEYETQGVVHFINSRADCGDVWTRCPGGSELEVNSGCCDS